MQSNRSVLALLLACSCNQVFSLEGTQPRDAAFFDAPPPSCPPIGTTPTFSSTLQQVAFQQCSDYTVATTGRVLAFCDKTTISEGELGGVLTAAGFQQPNVYFSHPRIHPDGERAVVRMITSTRQSFGVFERVANAWQMRAEFTVPFTILSSSAPTRSGRVIVATSNGGLRELADDGNGSWSETQSHSVADLGLVAVGLPKLHDQAHLSGDGLRLVFNASPMNSGTTQVLYTDRASVTEKFSAARALPNIEYFPNGFMTDDCARLYFAALDTVFYSEVVTSK